jgi:hypothetical protein
MFATQSHEWIKKIELMIGVSGISRVLSHLNSCKNMPGTFVDNRNMPFGAQIRSMRGIWVPMDQTPPVRLNLPRTPPSPRAAGRSPAGRSPAGLVGQVLGPSPSPGGRR